MPAFRPIARLVVQFGLSLGLCWPASSQQAGSAPPSFRVTSNLVFLDVTVVDKKGHPVVTGLTKDDFSITENGRPQRIFSFDAPDAVAKTEANAPAAGVKTEAHPPAKTEANTPSTILVLDLLNTPSEDVAFSRDSIRRYLALQPEQLTSPTELMVLNNSTLDLAHAYTRSRADLLYALGHVRQALPYKLYADRRMGSQSANKDFLDERMSQSIEALQQIAMQNKGLPGRKNILWVGYGGPSIPLEAQDPRYEKSLRFFVHGTTNLLVDARISLFLIYPGLQGAGNPDYMRINGHTVFTGTDFSDFEPFAGAVNFGNFVTGTGGEFFSERNDVDRVIADAVDLGSHYYTLTYQPTAGENNGEYRKIEVRLRDPNLRAMTKTGYYAPELTPIDNLLPQLVDPMYEISEAAQSSVVFDSLGVSIVHVARHPDSKTAELAILLKSTNLRWQSTDDGRSAANITMATVSLSGRRDILASKLQELTVLSSSQDAANLAQSSTFVTVTVPVPRHTQSIRVVIRSQDGGEIGTAELDQKDLSIAPENPSPEPQLVQRPPAVTLQPGSAVQ